MIHLKSTKVILFIALFAVLSLLSYLSLKESFKTALSGDDWLMLYTIWMDTDVRKSVSYWDISTYLSTYGPPYGFMSIIRHYFAYEPTPYYVISYISRVFASISIFYLVKNITKKIAPAFMASCIFAASFIGIQTTDWVFNFNHYFGITMLCLFLISYYKTKESQTLLKLILTTLFFAISLLISPNRMHGIFPLILVIEVGWLLIEIRKYSFKNAILRIIPLLITYKIVFSGAGYGSTEYNLSLVKKGLNLASDMLSKGQTWFLLNPLSTLGNYIVPDKLYKYLPFNEITQFAGRPGSFFIHTLAISGVIGLIGFLLLKLIDSKSKLVFPFGGMLIFWSFFMRWIKRQNPIDYSIYNADFATIGGGILILSIFIFFQLKRKDNRLAHILLVGTGWMVAFTVFTWILAPYTILETGLRYSIQQGVGSAIWFSVVLYIIIKNIPSKGYLRLIVVPVLIFIFSYLQMNIDLSNNYFRELNLHRSVVLDKKLWTEITTKVTDIPDDRSSIFYLIYDDYLTAEIGLRSGFSARAAMHYNIRNQNNNPYMIFNYADLQSIVTNGQAWTNQGEPVDVTPTNYIFAFELKNNNISDITKETRIQLQKDIKIYNESSKKQNK